MIKYRSLEKRKTNKINVVNCVKVIFNVHGEIVI